MRVIAKIIILLIIIIIIISTPTSIRYSGLDDGVFDLGSFAISRVRFTK